MRRIDVVNRLLMMEGGFEVGINEIRTLGIPEKETHPAELDQGGQYETDDSI